MVTLVVKNAANNTIYNLQEAQLLNESFDEIVFKVSL